MELHSSEEPTTEKGERRRRDATVKNYQEFLWRRFPLHLSLLFCAGEEHRQQCSLGPTDGDRSQRCNSRARSLAVRVPQSLISHAPPTSQAGRHQPQPGDASLGLPKRVRVRGDTKRPNPETDGGGRRLPARLQTATCYADLLSFLVTPESPAPKLI